jgi:MFS family permease
VTLSSASVRTDEAHAQRLRGLLVFGTLLALMETTLYTALSPLLPELASGVGLSATQVGALTAAYPAGLVLASLPAGWATSRVGPRVTAVAGLWLLVSASLGFAFSNTAVELYVTRFVQGAGSGAAWGGALAWLAAAYPVAQRGGAMGMAFSASFAGMLLGPAVGALAVAAGRVSTFSVIGGCLALVAFWGGPRHLRTADASRARGSVDGIRRPGIVIALSCVLLYGAVSGGLSAVGPLLLADRGLGAAAIAGCFIAAAAPQVLLTVRLGRRLGRSRPALFCAATMMLAAVLLPLAATVTGRLTAAVLFAVALGFQLMTFNPLMLLTSAVAERVGASLGWAMSLANGAWGLGAALGGLGLAKIADTASNSAAFLAAGLIALAVAVALVGASWAGVRGFDGFRAAR